MAEIYQKAVGDQMLIVGPRESMTRPFNVGSWNEILVGFYCSATGLATNNTAPPVENVTWHSVTDNLLVGIRNSSSTAIPGTAGAQYIGLVPQNYVSAGAESSNCNGNSFSTASGHMLAIAWNGTTVVGGGSYPAYSVGTSYQFSTPTAGSAYNGLLVFRYVVNNPGTATQTISFYFYTGGSEAGTNYSVDNLRSRMLAVGWTGPITLTWNAGGAALPLPDSIYTYIPFYNNKLRLSAMEIIKIS